MSKDTEKNIVLPTDALCAEMRSKGLVYADGRTAVLYDMGKKGAGTDLSTLGYGNNDVVKVTAKEDGTGACFRGIKNDRKSSRLCCKDRKGQAENIRAE